MAVYQTAATWLRQTFAWSNSWASWNERIALTLFLGVGVALLFVSAYAHWWQSAVLWVVYIIVLAVGTSQGWLKLFGPVLFYDMVRTARQNRYFAMRMLYSGLLLLILWVFFATTVSDRHPGDRDVAILAQVFFSIFMVTQLCMVVLLTPAYVAGAIAEEKDRKTLEFMLATDLLNHEIVLSKLLSRLANMALFLLTGLPILSILQFVGGVDTELMIAGFLGTGLTMLGIASISILFSTLFQRPRDAIGLSYLTLVAYGALGTLGKSLTEGRFFLMSERLWESASAPTYGDISDFLNAGNPIAAIADVGRAIDRATLATDLPDILARYTWFHGLLSLVCITWSIARLRTIALKQTVSGTTKKVGWFEGDRPVIGELPMVWKELYIEGRMKLNWLAWGVIVVLVLLTIGSGILVIAMYTDEWFRFGRQQEMGEPLSRSVNVWFRVAGTGLATLMLLMVAVRASTSVAAERERDTFDALLTTPLSAEAILAAKLLGVLTSVRLGWLWFGAMVALALFTGGLHLMAVPIIIGAWFVYAVFFAMLGMWFSMACRSSLRATVLTVLTALFLGGGHWLLMALCCFIPSFAFMHGGDGQFLKYIAMFEAGMTPPFCLGLFAYSWDNLAHDFHHELAEFFYFALIGIFLWAMACVFLWHGMLVPKIREITRREELSYQP